MQISICQRHNKKQKSNKILALTDVCLNNSCNRSYIILCSICRAQHRDHINQVIKLEDLNDLLNKLLTQPFKLSSKFLTQSVEVMKKIKLVKQFKRKIHILEAETIKQATILIEITQNIIHNYSKCKESVIDMIDKLAEVQSADMFEQLKKSLKSNLKNVEYNITKDVIVYSNEEIKVKEKNRKKVIDKTKRKIEQVKDYSMKIIQVILSQLDEEEQQQQQNVILMKKQYKMLKQQLNFNAQTIEEQYEDSSQSQYIRSKHPKQQFHKHKKFDFISLDRHVQTDVFWIKNLQQNINDATLKAQKYKNQLIAIQKELRGKISVLTRQKQFFKNDLKSLTIDLENSKKAMNYYYKILQRNCNERRKNQDQKTQTFNKIVQLIETVNLKRLSAQH